MEKTVRTVISDDLKELFLRYSRHAEFAGEKITCAQQVGLFGSQLLHLASFSDRNEDVALLIQEGADINVIGDLGLTPLHYAVLGGSINVVRLLINQGADLTVENEFGETPLQMAGVIQDIEMAAVLAEVDVTGSHGTDHSDLARNRWNDFKMIQVGNFWPGD